MTVYTTVQKQALVHGRCGICDRQRPLPFKDSELRECNGVCDDCVHNVMHADIHLQTYGPKLGIGRPKK